MLFVMVVRDGGTGSDIQLDVPLTRVIIAESKPCGCLTTLLPIMPRDPGLDGRR